MGSRCGVGPADAAQGSKQGAKIKIFAGARRVDRALAANVRAWRYETKDSCRGLNANRGRCALDENVGAAALWASISAVAARKGAPLRRIGGTGPNNEAATRGARPCA